EGQRIGANATLAAIDRALGRLHLVDGAAARAVSHLEAAIDRGGLAWGPDQRAETLFWLGTAYLSLGRAQQATACLEQAITVAQEASLPALLAGPAAEDGGYCGLGRGLGSGPGSSPGAAGPPRFRRPGLAVPPASF